MVDRDPIAVNALTNGTMQVPIPNRCRTLAEARQKLVQVDNSVATVGAISAGRLANESNVTAGRAVNTADYPDLCVLPYRPGIRSVRSIPDTGSGSSRGSATISQVVRGGVGQAKESISDVEKVIEKRNKTHNVERDQS